MNEEFQTEPLSTWPDGEWRVPIRNHHRPFQRKPKLMNREFQKEPLTTWSDGERRVLIRNHYCPIQRKPKLVNREFHKRNHCELGQTVNDEFI